MDRKATMAAAAGITAVLAGGVMPAAAATTAVTHVPCSAADLASAVSGAASGATLSLARGCRYVLTAALPTITQDLTIDGNRATLYRSAAPGIPAFTILTVTGTAEVTLNDLSFTNGNGAIVVSDQAQLTVTGGVFAGNTAASGGAAIYNTGAAAMRVTDSFFTGNRATGGGGNGGAIYINSTSENTITHCTFRSNAAGGDGGAVYDSSTDAVYSGFTSINNSTFAGNKAATGGALWLSGDLISGTVIHGNHATGDGGGIYNFGEGDAVSITGSEITGNSAGGAGGGLEENASLYLVRGSVTGTTIAGNSANSGGGVSNGPFTITSYTDDTISGNHATGGGGIIAIESEITFTGTTISGNKAGGNGGGIDGIGGGIGSVELTHSDISGNRAGALGGGIYNEDSVAATNTQITGNRAAAGGGGIYDDGSATVSLSSSSPVGNKPDNCEPHGSIVGCTG